MTQPALKSPRSHIHHLPDNTVPSLTCRLASTAASSPDSLCAGDLIARGQMGPAARRDRHSSEPARVGTHLDTLKVVLAQRLHLLPSKAPPLSEPGACQRWPGSADRFLGIFGRAGTVRSSACNTST